MKMRRSIEAVSSAVLVAGCTAQGSPQPQQTDPAPAIAFDSHLEHSTDTSWSNCWTDTHSWVSWQDSEPQSPANQYHALVTIGMHEGGHRGEDQSINLIAGASFRKIGKYSYVLATATAPDKPTEINLREKPFTEIQPAQDGYDVVFTARLGDDGHAYFDANCLPDIDFHGDMFVVPMTPETITPSESPAPGNAV